MDTITKDQRHNNMSQIHSRDTKIEKVTGQIIEWLDECADPELEIRG